MPKPRHVSTPLLPARLRLTFAAVLNLALAGSFVVAMGLAQVGSDQRVVERHVDMAKPPVPASPHVSVERAPIH